MSPHFVIVTPSFNLDSFIEQTIVSVATQAGDFTIAYHIQDGGSTDGTHAILAKWKEWLREGKFPVFCKGITFEYAVEKDKGMYHAINLGFGNVRGDQRPCIMAWINADDLLPPGSLAAVASFFQFEPDAEFVGGRTTLMSDVGFLAGIYGAEARLRSNIVAGIYHNEKHGFIQQEGIFWKSELWEKVGGLNDSLRLAGDFDLWRRMAAHAEYYCIDSLTGIHRRRAGQLSSNMEAYTEEVLELLKNEVQTAIPTQKYQTHFAYEMKENSWISTEDRSPAALERTYVEVLEHMIIFIRQHYQELREQSSRPWFLSGNCWRARHLKNQLKSCKVSFGYLMQQKMKDAQ